MTDAPKRIWLQIDPEYFESGMPSQGYWYEVELSATDSRCEVEYVRADLVEVLQETIGEIAERNYALLRAAFVICNSIEFHRHEMPMIYFNEDHKALWDLCKDYGPTPE